MSAPPRLLIVGSSTRAAAWSAIRAGFHPVCADQFGDEDLRQVAEVVPVSKYPDSLRKDLRDAQVRTDGCMFTGSHLWAISDLKSLEAQIGPYLGCREHVPDHRGLQIAARKSGARPLWVKSPSGIQNATGVTEWDGLPPADGSWMFKPLISGGGCHVRAYDSPLPFPYDEMPFMFYFQEHAQGRPCSATFAAGSPDRFLVGITEQIIGEEVAGAPEPFSYCGNIGPVSAPQFIEVQLTEIAKRMARKNRQFGPFGLDFLWSDQGVSVVECNPRYTASCELLELALRRPLLRDHWQACTSDPLPPTPPPPSSPAAPVLGKLILYARGNIVAPNFSRFLKPRSPWSVPFLADIPAPGTAFASGQPVCTVFASGSTPAAVREKLYRRARRVRRWLGDATESGPLSPSG